MFTSPETNQRVNVQVRTNPNKDFGYNAATGEYEDLMKAGIIDPAKVRYSVTRVRSSKCSNTIQVFTLCIDCCF